MEEPGHDDDFKQQLVKPWLDTAVALSHTASTIALLLGVESMWALLFWVLRRLGIEVVGFLPTVVEWASAFVILFAKACEILIHIRHTHEQMAETQRTSHRARRKRAIKAEDD